MLVCNLQQIDLLFPSHDRGGGVFPGTNTSNIESFNLTSGGDTTVFGNLSVARRSLGSTSSLTRGLFAGGYTPTSSNVIDYITFNSLGSASDFGNLTEARYSIGSINSSTRSVYAGNGTGKNVIDFVTTANLGNAIDFGDLSAQTGQALAGLSSSTRGVFGSGIVTGKHFLLNY